MRKRLAVVLGMVLLAGCDGTAAADDARPRGPQFQRDRFGPVCGDFTDVMKDSFDINEDGSTDWFTVTRCTGEGDQLDVVTGDADPKSPTPLGVNPLIKPGARVVIKSGACFAFNRFKVFVADRREKNGWRVIAIGTWNAESESVVMNRRVQGLTIPCDQQYRPAPKR